MANPKFPGLKEAILYNETLVGQDGHSSVEELADKFGCKASYIYRLRYVLGLKGGSTKPQTLTSAVQVGSSANSEGNLLDLLNEPLISQLDRLRILSRLIRTGAPAVKITAIKAYEELTRTSEGRVGPGAPLTEDDKVTRLARIMLAVPEVIARRAWETAYGYTPATAPAREALQATAGGISSPSGPSGELMPDLPIPTNRPTRASDRPLPPEEQSPGPTM